MAVPTIGDIVYLASCAMQVGVSAVVTPPDTPDQYTADLRVMGDGGDLSLDAVRGPRGQDGQPVFGLRHAPSLGYPIIDRPVDLPDLPNDTEHIGLYWLIDEVDAAGHVLAEWCYVWWGQYYRQIMMGVVGQPGPIPNIDLVMTAVDPAEPPQVLTSGGTLNPTWEFQVPAPIGPPGRVGSLFGMPDVDVVDQSPPGQLTATKSGSGGALAADTYYYVVTAVTSGGETFPSNEASVTTTGSTSKVVLAWNGAGVDWNVGSTHEQQIVTVGGSPTGGGFLLAVGGDTTSQKVTITGSPSGGHFTLTFGGDTTAETVTISGGPTGGTFSLSFGGHTASGLAYNASALAVQTALAALTGVGTGNVLVTGGDGGPYVIKFMNLVPTTTLTASSSLTGGSPAIAVTGLSHNATATAVQAALAALDSVAGNVSVTGSNGGPYTVTFTNLPAGVLTANRTFTGGSGPAIAVAGLAYNASASTVEDALTALGTVGTGNVTVTGPNGGPYLVQFVDLQAIAISALSQLTGGTAPSVTVAPAGYKIYRGTSADGEDVLVGAVPNTVLTFTDTGGVTTDATPPEPTLIKYVLAYTGVTADDGFPQWSPLNFEQFLPQTFSMPQSDFSPYVGISQQANIGSFVLPPQPFPWTPVVWGHISAGGLAVGSNPMMIGCQVVLDNQTSGQQIGRGLGNTLGEINIMPHYSQPGTANTNITPTNGVAVVAGSPTAINAVGTNSGGVLAASTSYFYKITAVTRDGIEAAPGVEVSVVTPASATSKVTLTWTAPAATAKVFKYKIYRGTSSDGEDTLAGTSSGTIFVDTGDSDISATPPPPTTLYINLYNDGQLGFYTFTPTPQPAPLQNLLDNLVHALGTPIATIENVVSLLGDWVGSIPAQIQNQLDAVAHLIGTSPVGQAVETGVAAVAQYLTAFQPLIDQLATALGINIIEDVINQVVTALQSFASTITAEIQGALDSVAQLFGLPGASHPIDTVVTQLVTLQPTLQNLADQLLQNTLGNVVTVINSFVGSVTDDIQIALDNVAAALSFVGSYTATQVAAILDTFQTNIDAVANALGINIINNTITDLIGYLVPWVTGEISGALSSAIIGLLQFLGATGLEATVLGLLGFLLNLLGDIFTGYTTAAQLFVMVQPMLRGTTTL